MSFKVTNSDYSKILNYYNIDIPKNRQDLKQRAEDLLALKLCSCIKKVGGPKNEARAIGVCTRTIFKRKGLKRDSFKCKNGRNISFKKSKRGMLPIERNKTKKNRRTM